MINPCCCHSVSKHYGKLQAASAIAGTLFTAGAIATALIPAVYAVTSLILPIALGVGGLIAWITLLALTINRCMDKPKVIPPNIPIIPEPTLPQSRSIRGGLGKLSTNSPSLMVENPEAIHGRVLQPQPGPPDPTDPEPEENKLAQELQMYCQNTKAKFLDAVKKELNESHYALLETAANTTCEAILEFAQNVTSPELITEIKSYFNSEFSNFASVAQALKEGKDDETRIQSFAAFTQLRRLFHTLRTGRVEKNHIEECEALLKQMGDINTSMNTMGDNPLVLLAKYGRPVEFVDILARYGADFNYKESVFGNTALIWAIANSHNEMAREIILKGKGNLDLKDDHEHGNTALILAVAKGYTTYNADGKPLSVSNLQLVQDLLVNGAKPNVKDNKGNSPLKIAVIRRNPEMIKELLRVGADVDFNWKELLELTYDQAFTLLKEQAVVCILDKEAFERSKQAVTELMS